MCAQPLFAVIPLALLATMAVMLPLNFSLDNLSLMALTIAVGFVVDDAIVMVEVIWKRIEAGDAPLDAALAGSGEISFTILTITISLIAVFTPLMFMGGVVGLLMREFAVTLSAAVVLSLVLSLTLTPMLCSIFLKAPQPASNPFTRMLEKGFRNLEGGYARALDMVLRHKLATLSVFLATMAAAVWLYATVSTGFFPQQDTGFPQRGDDHFPGCVLRQDETKVAGCRQGLEPGSSHRWGGHVHRHDKHQPGES
jgi:HAE1 family hydrophobic/amphiphilic exporter-1